MTRTLHLPLVESGDPDLNPVFNVVIAYEDLETGKHAKKTYDFLLENIGRDCEFTNQMWKFDVLGIPKLREIAAIDAAKADIIIISSHGGELPVDVQAWIELWVTETHNPIALVALFDQPSHTNAQTRAYLADVAKRGQMAFFAQPDEWPEHEHQELFALQRHPVFTEQNLSHLAHIVEKESGSRWGINE
jgi:hypothetical protein